MSLPTLSIHTLSLMCEKKLTSKGTLTSGRSLDTRKLKTKGRLTHWPGEHGTVSMMGQGMMRQSIGTGDGSLMNGTGIWDIHMGRAKTGNRSGEPDDMKIDIKHTRDPPNSCPSH